MSMNVLFTDVNGLHNLKQQAIKDQDKALPAVARQLESLFIAQMLKNMRKASLGTELVSSAAIDTSRELYDQQMAIELSEGKGIGIAQSLIQQLRQQKATQQETREADKPQEPDINPDGSLRLPIRRHFYTDIARFEQPRNNAPDSDKPITTLTEQKTKAVSATLSNTATITTPHPDASVKSTACKSITTPIPNQINTVGQTNNTPHAAPNLPQSSINFANAKEFVQKLWPMAEQSAKKLGVSPAVLISQAALETGWGKSILRASGKLSNNLFNIKADQRWQGEKIAKNVLEYQHGKPVTLRSYFRVYENIQQSFDDYADFIQKHPRYQKALQKAKNPEQYLHEIQQSGYATDPEYAKKILRIMHSSIIQEKLDT